MSAPAAEQCILVTGASSGIGRAVACLLNRLGATVIAHGRDLARLEELRTAAAHPERMHLAPRDLMADMVLLPQWVHSLREKHGRLSGLVCCAGMTWNAPLAMYDLTKAHALFDLCCHAPLLLGGAFCDRRVNVGSGSAIVYIAAAAATMPNAGQGVYAAAKAALIAAAQCQAREVAARGIRVNCVSPGLVQSPMLDDTVRQLGQEFLDRERAHYPLGLGQPEDVAELVAFVLSGKARWLTAQNMLLSGGR